MNSCRSVFVNERVAKTAVAPRFVHLTLNLCFLFRRQLFHVLLKVEVIVKERAENFFDKGIALHSVSVRDFVEVAVLLDCKSCGLLERQADAFDGVNDSKLFESGHDVAPVGSSILLCAEVAHHCVHHRHNTCSNPKKTASRLCALVARNIRT
jgi:hypothetical protein